MAENSRGRQSKFEMVIGAVNRFSTVFRDFNDRVDTATDRIRRMQRSVGDLNRASGLSRLSGSVSGVAQGMRNVVGEGKNLLSTVTGLAGRLSLLFGATGGGLLALAKSTANAGAEAADAAARAGVGVKTWQEYAHAAAMAGVSNEQLEKGLTKLQGMAVKAFQGDKTQRGLLKLAGIDPKTAAGEVKNADTLLQELSEKVRRLQEAGEGAKAANLLRTIMGDDGAKLMPLLQGGRKALLDMRQQAHALGLVFDTEDTAAAADFNSALAVLGSTFRGIGHTIGKQLLPPLTKLIKKFSEWLGKQREIIGAKFTKWMEALSKWADELDFDAVTASIGRLFDKVSAIADAFGGWENVLIAVAAAIGGQFLSAIASMISAFSMLGFALLATPVGWFLLAVAAIAGIAYLIYRKWDGIAAFFKGLWQDVKDAFDRNWVEGVVKLLENFSFKGLISKSVNALIAYLTGVDLSAVGNKMVDSLREGISNKWGELTAWFREKLDSLVSWLPDWMQEKMGFNVSLAAPAAPTFGEPMQAGAMGRDMMRTMHSEHVERQENTVRLVPPDGWDMRVSGPTSGIAHNGTSLQIGQLATMKY